LIRKKIPGQPGFSVGVKKKIPLYGAYWPVFRGRKNALTNRVIYCFSDNCIFTFVAQPLIVFNQHRIFRIFQLLSSLRCQPPKEIGYLCNQLGTSERTIYRYFDLLKQAGFNLHVDSEGRYALHGSDLAPYLMLSDEESRFLTTLLTQAPAGDPLADNIREKLGLLGKTATAAEWVYQGKISRHIQLLTQAMTERRQVILKSYHSASSGTISHRLVEPVAFTDHYQSISAYEPASGCNKYFNIERIEEVELLDTLHAHEGEHEFRRPDAFGYQITTPAREVFMIMEMAPMLYVRRLYPMARPQIRETKRPGFYELKLEVGNYTAPAGIVRLFPNQVKVYGDNGFLRFLKKERSKRSDSE